MKLLLKNNFLENIIYLFSKVGCFNEVVLYSSVINFYDCNYYVYNFDKKYLKWGMEKNDKKNINRCFAYRRN